MTGHKSFLTRTTRTDTIRLNDGRVIRTERCDLTVSLRANGVYRCYKCPGMPTPDDHWTTRDPAEMAMHAVDHKIAGLAVPDKGLVTLVAFALQGWRG